MHNNAAWPLCIRLELDSLMLMISVGILLPWYQFYNKCLKLSHISSSNVFPIFILSFYGFIQLDSSNLHEITVGYLERNNHHYPWYFY